MTDDSDHTMYLDSMAMLPGSLDTLMELIKHVSLPGGQNIAF